MLDTEDLPEASGPNDEPVEIPEGVPPETRGSKQFALFAFIGIFVAILGSAVLYLASRRTAAPPSATPWAVVQQAPAQPKPQAAPPPATPAVVEAAAVKPEPSPTAAVPPTATVTPAAPAPAISVPAAPVNTRELSAPLPNRLYLQVGSLEKGVAEIMAQGLRIKGIPTTVAPGVTSVVSRIIAGPFDDAAQAAAAEKQLRELGFQPFPRRFDANELREIVASASQQPAAKQ